MPENYIKCESFTVISIDSLLAYENKYYLQVYWDNCSYKIVNKKMTDYLNENIFEIKCYKCCYNRIDNSEGSDLFKSNTSKECIFATIGFFLIDSNFKIIYAMVVAIWQD